MRCFLVLSMLACGVSSAWAGGLYESRTIVTGMDQRSRPAGLRTTLGQVLAKVAGNPALRADPRLAEADITALLSSFAYLDRMSDQPRRDEQGTRDRPYDLVARFDPAAIDGLLRRWGEAPWTAPRPPVVVKISITPRSGATVDLRADTDPDERHRAALLDAADRFGLDVVLPAATDGVMLPADAPVLSGTMRWSDPDAGWQAEWRLDQGGSVARWSLRGAGFDAAYQDAMGGAAAVLSGHAVRPGSP